MRRWLLIVLTSFTFTGCTMVYMSFFRNYSEQPVQIEFQAPTGKYSERPKTIRYRNEILEIKWKAYKQVNDSLPVSFYNARATITVPAGSTVLLPRFMLHDSLVILKQQNRIDSVSHYGSLHNRNIFQYKNVGFPVKTIFYYDYK